MSNTCDIDSIWSEHKAILRNFILKRVRDNSLTDDILQEVLLRIYHSCKATSGVKNLRAWLFTIAYNHIVDYYRKSRNMFAGLPEVVNEDQEQAFHEAASFIMPLLSFLPPAYSLPLKLSDIDGIKQVEIAKTLGLTLTATKSRIQRARQMLKDKFITCCYLETQKNGGLISVAPKAGCQPLQEYLKTSSFSCCAPSIELK